MDAAEAGRSEHLPAQQQLTRSQLVAWGAPDGTRLHITRPLVTQEARLDVHCTRTDGGDTSELIEKTKQTCMVANTLQRGVKLTVGTRAS